MNALYIIVPVAWLAFIGSCVWGWFIAMDPAPSEAMGDIQFWLWKVSLLLSLASTAALIMGRDV